MKEHTAHNTYGLETKGMWVRLMFPLKLVLEGRVWLSWRLTPSRRGQICIGIKGRVLAEPDPTYEGKRPKKCFAPREEQQMFRQMPFKGPRILPELAAALGGVIHMILTIES